LDLNFLLFIAELDDTANKYQTLDASVYVFLTLPRRFTIILPLGAFWAAWWDLGSDGRSSELTVYPRRRRFP